MGRTETSSSVGSRGMSHTELWVAVTYRNDAYVRAYEHPAATLDKRIYHTESLILLIHWVGGPNGR